MPFSTRQASVDTSKRLPELKPLSSGDSSDEAEPADDINVDVVESEEDPYGSAMPSLISETTAHTCNPSQEVVCGDVDLDLLEQAAKPQRAKKRSSRKTT